MEITIILPKWILIIIIIYMSLSIFNEIVGVINYFLKKKLEKLEERKSKYIDNIIENIRQGE